MEQLKIDTWGTIVCYLCIINTIGFFLMGIDKWKARNKQWRVAEKTFFAVSLLGGSLGTWIGMYVFRHKTKHQRFVILMPLICIVHVFLAVYVFYRLFG